MLSLHPDVVDVLLTDEGGLVMRPRELLQLGPIAALIVSSCATPTTPSDLAATCEEEFGAPPGGDTLTTVTALIEELTASGILAVID
ncbi:MAG: PqqD family protein [Propionibacteriaceae bacterium]|nr:PqqD family protein [Propionibacteriaceae bacterium]